MSKKVPFIYKKNIITNNLKFKRMNKQNFCFVIAIIFFGVQQMMSQTIVQGTSSMSRSDLAFAAKAGFNLSSLGGDSRYDYAAKPGFHIGGLVEIPFSDEILLQPEALLSFQGNGAYFDEDINLLYLSIPLIAKYNVWDELYVEAGPQLGLLLSNNIDRETYGNSYVNDPDVNSLDVGLAIGAGYRLDENFYFQIRFNPGFVNVIEDFKSKNRVMQLSACYFF